MSKSATPRYQTWSKLYAFPSTKFVGKSLTVSPKSLSLTELVKRNLGHLIEPSDPKRAPQYFGSVLMPDLSRMDIVDLRVYRDHVNDLISDAKAKIDAEASAKADVERKKAENAERIERLKAQKIADKKIIEEAEAGKRPA